MLPYLLLLLIIGSMPLCAQDTPLGHTPPDTAGTNLFAGYHGISNHYVELGYAHVPSPNGGYTDLGYTISGAVRLGGTRIVGAVVVGTIASIWANAELGPGINLEYFDDLHGCYAVRIRPELAWRHPRVHIAYGYPLSILDHGIAGVNTHNLSVRVFLPL